MRIIIGVGIVILIVIIVVPIVNAYVYLHRQDLMLTVSPVSSTSKRRWPS